MKKIELKKDKGLVININKGSVLKKIKNFFGNSYEEVIKPLLRLLAGLIIFLCGIGILSLIHGTESPEQKIEIFSIDIFDETYSNLENFAIGATYDDDELYYIVYKSEGEGKKLLKLSAEKTIIYDNLENINYMYQKEPR